MAIATKKYTKNVPFYLDPVETIKTIDDRFSRTGYTFVNWIKEDGTFCEDGAELSVSTEEYTISANWEIKHYPVTTDVVGEGTVTVYKNGEVVPVELTSCTFDYNDTFTVEHEAAEGWEYESIEVIGATEVDGVYTVDDSDPDGVTITVTFKDVQGTLTYHPGY